eukprot:m.240895 g.240895  ORF g.240895 m.240895 type:complete len:315 (+) comp10938_c0_seq6:891-1835(+)
MDIIRYTPLAVPQRSAIDQQVLDILERKPNCLITVMCDDFYFSKKNSYTTRNAPNYTPAACVGFVVTLHPDTQQVKISRHEHAAFFPPSKNQVDSTTTDLLALVSVYTGTQFYWESREETKRSPFSPRNIYLDGASEQLHPKRGLQNSYVLSFQVDSLARTADQMKQAWAPMRDSPVLQKIVERQRALLLPCDFGVQARHGARYPIFRGAPGKNTHNNTWSSTEHFICCSSSGARTRQAAADQGVALRFAVNQAPQLEEPAAAADPTAASQTATDAPIPMMAPILGASHIELNTFYELFFGNFIARLATATLRG